MNIVKLVIAFILSFGQIMAPYAGILFHGGVNSFFEDWSTDSVYETTYAVELEKDPNKDFVVLNFTDIQLSPDRVFSESGEFTYDLIRQCVDEVKPDLITLTGDNSTSTVGYVEIVKLMESFGIPWAPVMGNHDGENGQRIRECWDSYLLSHAENCLFKFGPADMGYGNYIINITENGKVIHSIFMMDSHSSAEDTEAGKINYAPDGTHGYDHLWANQIQWYEWAVNGIAEKAGHTVESSCFMHIPVYEFRTARDLMCNKVEEGEKDHYYLKDEYSDGNFGALYEGICSAEGNNGFFEVAKRLGSTKNMIFGHDHINNMSVVYDGIRLSYGLKSGHGSYWDDDMMGGSMLAIASDGSATFSHHQIVQTSQPS